MEKLSRWQEQEVRRKIREIRRALLKGDREHEPMREEDVSSEDEMFKMRLVATAYPDDKRNKNIAESSPGDNFEVHAIFVAVEDDEERWRLVNSRDDWTIETAEKAVERYQSAIDGERRLRGEE